MVRMIGRHGKFNAGARVRLLGTVDPSIYGDYACVGNEGIIRDVREDRFGLPEVYIQWDTNHWAYNGVQDCWTFPDHFGLAEDDMSQQDKMQELMAMFAQGLSQIMGSGEPQDDRGSPQSDNLRNRLLEAAQPFQQESQDDEFLRAVEDATERLKQSAAFVIVGIDHREHPGAPQGILEPFAVGFSKIPEGDALVTAHMSKVAAAAHQNLALQLIAMPDES